MIMLPVLRLPPIDCLTVDTQSIKACALPMEHDHA